MFDKDVGVNWQLRYRLKTPEQLNIADLEQLKLRRCASPLTNN